MASITWWNRVEPRPRTADIVSPLQAKLRDPLWMLTRQWQLGEFMGVDGGSPAWVQLTERAGALASWLRPDGTSVPLAAAPLEQQLETEPFTPDLATRVELGQILGRLLVEAAVDPSPFLVAYPIQAAVNDPADPVEAQLRRVCAGRTMDGVAAYLAIKAGDPAVPPAPPATLQAFVSWVQTTVGDLGKVQDAPTWQPARLEYLASATATIESGTATLTIRPGDDGLIDWAAFDVASATTGTALPTKVRTIVPAHVRFKGMPNARFWDFENGTIDFGDLKPDKRDLARLALMDFMLVHANDWFMLPVDLPVGSTYQLDSLIVHDVFGIDTLIPRADQEALGAGNWTMFSTSVTGTTTPASFHLLPPSAAAAFQSGRVVEEVRFARDEMANMVWALENTLENAAGEPWPQHERDAALNPLRTLPTTQNPVPLAYDIESRVPLYWIPFLPVSLDPVQGTVVLELAQAIAQDGTTPILPRSRILKPTGIPTGAPYQLPEEEVPRNGVTVQRLAARSRWIDGSTRIWQLRRVLPGTGEAQSALRFDQALPNS
jgi:hypothetical protein